MWELGGSCLRVLMLVHCLFVCPCELIPLCTQVHLHHHHFHLNHSCSALRSARTCLAWVWMMCHFMTSHPQIDKSPVDIVYCQPIGPSGHLVKSSISPYMSPSRPSELIHPSKPSLS